VLRLAHPVHGQLWLEVPELEEPGPTVTMRLGCSCGRSTEVEVSVAVGGPALASLVEEASRRLVAFESRHRGCAGA
jgi:hypothetical protein